MQRISRAAAVQVLRHRIPRLGEILQAERDRVRSGRRRGLANRTLLEQVQYQAARQEGRWLHL